MGLSFSGPRFSGPQAPAPRRPSLLGEAARVVAAALLACMFTAAGAGGMLLTGAPRWLGALVEPFSLALIPGAMLESIDRNPYAFSRHGVVWLSTLFWFFVFCWLLMPPRGRRKTETEDMD